MEKIKNWIKSLLLKSEDTLAEIEISKDIERLLIEESDKWEIGNCYAKYGTISIWIENSPYADFTLNSRRLKRRPQLRKALLQCQINQARNKLKIKLK